MDASTLNRFCRELQDLFQRYEVVPVEGDARLVGTSLHLTHVRSLERAEDEDVIDIGLTGPNCADPGVVYVEPREE